MITKAKLLLAAQQQELQPTTIEKDYVLGWILLSISNHRLASEWVFKGGTCLKKCFFETYRFSEDLDFTIPKGEPYDEEEISQTIHDIIAWVETESGIVFPRDGIVIEEYSNPRGNTSFQLKTSFVGPLQMPRRSLQRIKFDLTQDEILVDNPDFRPCYHPYGDFPDDTLQSFCYSVNEILAEKSRALFERQGRARDVYDVIHISRAFRDAVDVETAVDVLQKKFEFKDLPEPTVASILNRIDEGILEANWSHQLGHQLPVLPNVRDFIDGLFEALVWWIDPPKAQPLPSPISTASSERSAQRRAYPASLARAAMRAQRGKQFRYDTARIEAFMSRIVYAARNQLCIEITYKGVRRIVEPYSLRYPRTGNTLLYVWERVRESLRTNQIKALSLFGMENVRITDEPFRARYRIEL